MLPLHSLLCFCLAGHQLSAVRETSSPFSSTFHEKFRPDGDGIAAAVHSANAWWTVAFCRRSLLSL